MDDQSLLDRFAKSHDADAFEELTRRYWGLVYSSAQRQVRDVHLAEDVTQAVFIVLANRAGSIRRGVVLSSWLFTVTRHAVCNAKRMLARQRYHESRKAAMSSEQNLPLNQTDDRLLPLVDEAVLRLSEGERSAVLLRYFENRTHGEIAGALGLSQDCSRKRLDRALQKMRRFLEGRGVIASDLSIGSILAGPIVPHAPLLVKGIANVAVLSRIPIGANAGARHIAQGVLHMFNIARIKVASVAAAIVLVAGFSVALSIKLARADAPATKPTAIAVEQQAARGQFSVSAGKDVKVSFLGVSPFMGERDSWFAIDGSPINAPDFAMPEGQINAEPAPQNQILVRIDKPKDVVARVKVADASVVANMAHQDQDGLTLLVSFAAQGHAKSAALTVGIAEAEWKTLATNEKPDQAGNFDDKEYGEFSFLPVGDEDGLASVVVEHRHIEEPCEVFAVDAAGEKHRPNKVKAQSDGESEQITYGYDIPAKNVSKLLVQVRPFSKFVDVKDISLEKGRITKPTIEVRDAEKK